MYPPNRTAPAACSAFIFSMSLAGMGEKQAISARGVPCNKTLRASFKTSKMHRMLDCKPASNARLDVGAHISNPLTSSRLWGKAGSKTARQTRCAASDSPPSSPPASPELEQKANLKKNMWQYITESDDFSVLMTALGVGTLTGAAVVLFNLGIHSIHDVAFGDAYIAGASAVGPKPGVSWRLQQPESMLKLVLIPTIGGIIVSMIRYAIGEFDEPGSEKKRPEWYSPIGRAFGACITLASGNSLGPEGPSVEIGTNIAKAVNRWQFKRSPNKVSEVLIAASGSASGVSAGFNAVVGGAFFAVETVLQRAKNITTGGSLGLTSEVVLLSAIAAQVMSRIGLGDEPAFQVPFFDILSITELPLYLPLGALCGLYAIWFNKLSTYSVDLFSQLSDSGIPKYVHPPLGGLATGCIALCFPEVLYSGFENVDVILQESTGLYYGVDLLIEILIAKLLATTICRASGLVGGIYAPSLMVGACIGSAYGQILQSFVEDTDILVAPFQAYALVGMGATLASVCSVPLTSVLLLFELTQDYSIILPLMFAVSVASAVATFYSDEPVEVDLQEPVEVPTVVVERITSTLDEDPMDVRVETVYSYETLKRLRVYSAMSTSYLVLDDDMTVPQAAQALLGSGQSAAVVVSSDSSKDIVGVITLVGISLALQDSSIRAPTFIKDCIAPCEILLDDQDQCILVAPNVIDPEENLLNALRQLHSSNTPVLTVVNNGVATGILDESMINFRCQQEDMRKQLNDVKIY